MWWFGKKQVSKAALYYGHRLNLWRCYNRCNPSTLAEFIKCVEADASNLGHEDFKLTEVEILILATLFMCYIGTNTWLPPGPLPAKEPIPYLPPTYGPNYDEDLKTYLARLPVSDHPLVTACMQKVIEDHNVRGIPIDYWLVCAMPAFFDSYTWGSEFDPSRLQAEHGSGALVFLRWY